MADYGDEVFVGDYAEGVQEIVNNLMTLLINDELDFNKFVETIRNYVNDPKLELPNLLSDLIDIYKDPQFTGEVSNTVIRILEKSFKKIFEQLTILLDN